MNDIWRNAAGGLAARQGREAEHLAAHGLYDPADEHDACGVGLVAAIDGRPRRQVVEYGIEALKAVWHRGAVDADGNSGDGAGIHVQIPQEFFRQHVRATGHEPTGAPIAVGMVFLPRTDLDAQEACRVIVESEILRHGLTIYGWRQAPVNVACLGEKAATTRPEIEQIMIESPEGADERKLELDLYVIRRRIEKRVAEERISGFYICSLSCRSVIYKGMFLAEQLSTFYPDLTSDQFISNFAVYHQRYSTNTFPTWPLAQPFRVIAHNGEINTLRGNVNWMRAHEARIGLRELGGMIDDIKPVIQPGSSDSASLDAAFELMIRAGRDLPMTKTMLIPEAWGSNESLSQNIRDMYAYANSVMEPWDGPAAICGFGGRWAMAGMDRNGLRPLRYTVTGDGVLIAGSETGMVKVAEPLVVEKGRLGPGQMIAVDLVEGRLWHDRDLKERLAGAQDFGSWLKNEEKLSSCVKGADESPRFTVEELRRRQHAAGITLEDLEMILQPMAEDGKEPTGSMGDDTPLAVLSDRYRGLHAFFRQNFSQVTNPPIDSLRERHIMTLKTRLGNLSNILDESEEQLRILLLDSPVLTNGEFARMIDRIGGDATEIDCTLPASGGAGALRADLARIRQEAEDAVRGGKTTLVLTDHGIGPDRAPMPMILATGAIHTHLLRQSLRTFCSLNVRSGECMDTHCLAVLVGVGATTVNPYLAQEGIADRLRRGLLGDRALEECVAAYKQALGDGLLKIMSKMGISVVSSYRGGANFEAIGLSRSLCAEYFPGLTSRISGIGLTGIQKKLMEQHRDAYAEGAVTLPVGGLYRFRRSGEAHAFDGRLMHMLQQAVKKDTYSHYKKYSEGVQALPPINIRDLLGFKPDRRPIPLDDVESITELRKRLVAPGISLGALSPEAHETLSIAMNRIGAKSDSGEGGEDRERYRPRPNGDNASSAIKQVASGRFGVTAEYLNNCREIEIKVAQGAKPGEGGQIPGFKVTGTIARLRHSTPGVTLISPPPHHDIYSIEDLAQLIYDLKQINPKAKVCVKLVARSGIGTIAAGVAKASADAILVSGHSGGTGASPQSSIKHAGLPWELGVAEVHQVLKLNRLRHRVVLRTDGGFKTGRDVVIAALLGAEEFGIGTTSLIAMGCIMVRQCHSNTCPVGVCTQDERLREKFGGSPEKVVNLFSFIAEEVREILAGLGYGKLTDIVGRTDLLTQVSRGAEHLDDLDLNPILAKADTGDYPSHCTIGGRNEVPETLDARMIEDAAALFDDGEKMQLQYTVRNTHRAVGAKMSHKIERKFGMTGLQPGHLTVKLRGSAGQSLGAFGVRGLKIEVVGDANDYVGKGLSGGAIVIRPRPVSPLVTRDNTIIGNTVLYGATAGQLYAAGQAGERFCVRNSGAEAVVEGCGSNGCEYMTGGTVAILGPVGPNFGAGMTGGMAFVYDDDDSFERHVNPASVVWHRLQIAYWEAELIALVRRHVDETGSVHAESLLRDWPLIRSRFWQVVPREIIGALDVPTMREEAANTA